MTDSYFIIVGQAIRLRMHKNNDSTSIERVKDRHHEIMQFVLFVIVGALSTVVNYGVFIFSLKFFRIHYVFSNWMGYIAGVLLGYSLNARFTFNAGAELSRNCFFRYVAVYVISLVISNCILYGMVEWLMIPPEIANFIAILQTTTTNYLGCKLIVFRVNQNA